MNICDVITTSSKNMILGDNFNLNMADKLNISMGKGFKISNHN